MSAESEKIRDTFANQLASFEDRLEAKADDVEMLADIQDGIAGLLSSDGNSEAEIRRILQERYEAGGLRKETFQLVKSMLDGYVTERVPTTPAPENIAQDPEVIDEDPPLMKSPSIMEEAEALGAEDDAYSSPPACCRRQARNRAYKLVRCYVIGSCSRSRWRAAAWVSSTRHSTGDSPRRTRRNPTLL